MGRNTKKKQAVAVESSSGSSSEAGSQPATPREEKPSEPKASSSTTPAVAWVEIAKSDKKKVTTLVKGLEAYGIKLPAVAAQLKKMIGPVDVVKSDGESFLEFQGDVVGQATDVLVTKFNIPKEAVTQSRAKASEAQAALASTTGAAPSAAAVAAAVAAEDAAAAEALAAKKGIEVRYCPICTFPMEMCEYSGMFEKCKAWKVENLSPEEIAALDDMEEKGRKRRALTEQAKLDHLLSGKGKKKVEQVVVMEVKVRSGKKKVTIIHGLDLFGLNMTDLSRDFKKTFSCGAGIVEEPGQLPAIEVQGDVIQALCESLPTKYNIPAQAIYFMDGKTKVQAHA